MYFVLGRLWARFPARLPDVTTYDRQGVWWNDGARFNTPIRTPIIVSLEPFDSRSSDQSQDMPAYIDGKIPLFRDDLIAALASAGVDNLDIYDALVLDPDNKKTYKNFKAVNIIGLVSAADMIKSESTVHDGIPVIDVSFDSLVIDENKSKGLLMFRLAENNSGIIVHENIKDYLLNAGFNELEFFNPENIAL